MDTMGWQSLMMIKLHESSSPNLKLDLPIGILQLQLMYQSAGFSSCTEYTKEATAYQNSKNLAEREKKSQKRKELLSGSYMVYTRLMHAISKRYFLPMVIASITTGFTGYLSMRVWH